MRIRRINIQTQGCVYHSFALMYILVLHVQTYHSLGDSHLPIASFSFPLSLRVSVSRLRAPVCALHLSFSHCHFPLPHCSCILHCIWDCALLIVFPLCCTIGVLCSHILVFTAIQFPCIFPQFRASDMLRRLLYLNLPHRGPPDSN